MNILTAMTNSIIIIFTMLVDKSNNNTMRESFLTEMFPVRRSDSGWKCPETGYRGKADDMLTIPDKGIHNSNQIYTHTTNN